MLTITGVSGDLMLRRTTRSGSIYTTTANSELDKLLEMWTSSLGPYVCPIVGGRKVSHLKGNIDALGVKLTAEEIDEIDAAEPFDVGFPMNFLFGYGGKTYKTGMGPKDIQLITTNNRIESVPKVQPIPPRQGEQHYGPE